MSRRKRTVISPNLFPFLAVLVCTLGTLILLLALVAQKAEESAEELVDQGMEAARLIAEEERWEADVLIEHRRKQTEELDKRRSELAHVEDHARRLREELDMLKQEIEATENEGSRKNDDAVASRLVALRKRSEREKELIADLEKERDGKPPRVVIVPYKGSNGTDRRPIYVECTSTAVIIQPEGVRITASQLDGPMGPGNPLDAALRAVRSHWQTLDEKSPPPYPLLLVRPSGIHAYAASRIAMSTWDDQFGYELIPEDLELAFPVKDPALEIKLVESIQVAIARNRARIAGAPSKYGSPSNYGGLTPQRIARSSEQENAGRSPYGGGSAADRTGQPSQANRSTQAGVTENPYADVRSGRGRENRDITIDGADLMVKRDSIDGSGSGNGRGTGISGTFAGDDGFGLSEPVTEGSINGERRPTDSSLAGPSLTGPSLTGPMLNGPSLPGAETSGQPAPNDLSGTGSAFAEQRRGAQQGESSGGANEFVSEEDFFGAAGNPLGPDGSQGAGQLSSGQMSGGAGSGSANTAQASAPAMSAAAMADPRQKGSSFNTPPEFDPHEKTFSETMEDRFSPSAARGSSSNQSSDSTPVLAGGNNWALPESMASRRGASIVRELKLQCSANGFLLLPETSEQRPQEFPIQDGLVERSVMNLAQAIRGRVERWGVAMQNGRWDPVLSVQVAEGGETRFRQLEMLLKNSGVRVERERVR